MKKLEDSSVPDAAEEVVLGTPVRVTPRRSIRPLDRVVLMPQLGVIAHEVPERDEEVVVGAFDGHLDADGTPRQVSEKLAYVAVQFSGCATSNRVESAATT